MDIFEAFRLAWVGITTNKFRSFLTMLGMIIGVGSVIAMISIGDGAQATIVDSLSGLGTGSVTLSGGYGQMRLTLDNAYYLKERASSVAYMYPNYTISGSVKYGSTTENYSVIGTTPDYAVVQQWKPSTGSFIVQDHIDSRSRVAVIGQTVAEELFANASPISKSIRINGEVFEVVGIMETKGTSMGTSTDNQIFIPVSTAMRMQQSKYVNQITFMVEDPNLSKIAVGEITVALEEIFGDQLQRENPFRFMSMDDLIDTMNSTIGTFTLLLAGIAGISLLVGGIGIMNIMLVSVTERTREIGIRKALGARHIDLLSQFLIEAILISLTGGAIGMILGIVGSQVVASYAGWSQVISSNAILLALGFSSGVGLFFGVYPANKAARMDPIDALRFQ